ncbi:MULTISPECIES: MarR family winged helix-turn-helix transcriptional regulator [Dyadobacter]|jgi:DNA-binding MarR family transcriptional regulator|uniref:MarR family winged helix-turn-helix transcriptional regulator n=1 Tax=Dyadobacter chenhuakuii TaxID=2909339 RepID=A0A9X1QDK6_9BACT|nr:MULTISPECIES: MarR family winged helix-turn-helix transcriptional regulator [Dyadobacter]MCF2493256.1 MarR family winged helix-turn-helix transcriptional regulator [Dyadobacter chenhuakuii]MCF2497854.1 MarR family winged helix-turn-helix transcriptional regulator [Dyadobacter chenhuakuii]MCF2517359.1 MarR family winged helix-turn-helix transcriptional regulator [Dyadobacter sp. CY351]USJ32461.1 MarR family winged helix-turn-helix transcriptional regulator [Dyadobacter chenhuakuii]
MSTITPSLKLFLNLTTVQALITKRFDAKLSSHGISLNEFLILFHLGEAPEEKMRRVDLAEKIGLTASGITRMLSPLEKLGMVKREANSRDARVSYVKLANAGKRILTDATATSELLSEQILSTLRTKKLDDLSKMLVEMGGTIE